MKGLDRAVLFFGTQSSLARALGVCPMAVSHWQTRGVPPARVIAIEAATNGLVTRSELRPDLWPPEKDSRPTLITPSPEDAHE